MVKSLFSGQFVNTYAHRLELAEGGTGWVSYGVSAHSGGQESWTAYYTRVWVNSLKKDRSRMAWAIDAQFSLVFVNCECSERNRLNNLCPMNSPSLWHQEH
jgi:hypothetical protein